MDDPLLITAERRAHSRVPGPFAVRVRLTGAGHQCEIRTLVDNLSEGGLYLQLPSHLARGGHLFTFIRLYGGANLAAQGWVLRTETRAHGLSGIAVGFRRTRLLPGPEI